MSHAVRTRAALYVVACVIAVRVMNFKFVKQVRLLVVTLPPFLALAALSGIRDGGHIAAWVAVVSLLPLAGLHIDERKRRVGYAENEAIRFGGTRSRGVRVAGGGGGVYCVRMCAASDEDPMRCCAMLHVLLRARALLRSESQRQSTELVHAMLPSHVTRAIRDGARQRAPSPCGGGVAASVANLWTPHVVCLCSIARGEPHAVAALAGVPIVPTEQQEVALLMTDIIGFTALSATIGPEEVVQMLDTCAAAVAARWSVRICSKALVTRGAGCTFTSTMSW